MIPKFSICIFTYNRAEYLSTSIKSALNQIFPDYEIIVVDDGSNDNTEEVVKSFDSAKIKYVKKEHSGAPRTRNRAITEANGEYIVWLADDDMLLPAALQYYSTFLKKDPRIDVLYSHLRMFNSDSENSNPRNATEWYHKNDEALAFLLKGSPVTDGGCAVRKKIYEQIGNYNENFSRAQDYEFWSRLIQKQKYILKLVPKYLYLYRIHNSNITGKFKENTDFSYEVKIINQLLEKNSLEKLFPDFDWKNDVKESEFQAYLFLAMKHLFIKTADIGVSYLEKANKIRDFDTDEIQRLVEIIERFEGEEKDNILNTVNNNSSDNLIKEYESVMKEIEEGNYQTAEKKLDTLFQQISYSKNNTVLDLADVKILLANICLLNKNYKKATKLFENVLEENPTSSGACQGLGEILLINNDIESAKTMFEWAVIYNNTNNAAFKKLSNLNKILNLPDDHNSVLIAEEN